MLSRTQQQFSLAIVLSIVGALLLGYGWEKWPWGAIGLQLELAGIILMLSREQIEKYGNSFKGKANAEQLASSGWRPFARCIHNYVYAIGLPLVVLGAWMQMLGNPRDDLLLRLKELPPGVVFSLDKETREVDVFKLDEALKILRENQDTTTKEIKKLFYSDLLLVNCDKAAECNCPETHRRVKDSGKWNLNAGTTGDSITLCVANTAFPATP